MGNNGGTALREALLGEIAAFEVIAFNVELIKTSFRHSVRSGNQEKTLAMIEVLEKRSRGRDEIPVSASSAVRNKRLLEDGLARKRGAREALCQYQHRYKNHVTLEFVCSRGFPKYIVPLPDSPHSSLLWPKFPSKVEK